MTFLYVTPDSEAYFRSGLAKSAFGRSIYGDLPLDFFIPGIDMTSRLARLNRAAPKFYQAHDMFLAFFRDYESVFKSLKKSNKAAPAWRAFVEGLVRRPEFLELNQLTRGSFELAAAAAARTLAIALQMRVQIATDPKHTYDLDTLNQVIKEIEQGRVDESLKGEIQGAGGAQKYLRRVERWLRDAGKSAAVQLPQVLEELREYMEARREAEAAAAALAGGHGYSLEGLSIWHFMERPDDFRRRVRLLTGAALALRHFSRALPASLSHQVSESLWGGVDGVTRMTQYSQIAEALPSELALARASRALFAARLASMSLHVYRHAASVKPVIFLDKSGSMAEPLPGEPGQLGHGDASLRQWLGATEYISVPKISLAAGLALALYRRLGGLVYLFDTECDLVQPRDVVKTLLTIKADGGTNVDPVLEEIMRLGRGDYVYIIVSDGITEASRDVLRRLEASGLARQVRLILVPPSGDGYSWVEVVRRHGRVLRAHDVSSFAAAARQALA
jgi:uncharacterized protein with von Willebrand factor type A (vWA) domain